MTYPTWWDPERVLEVLTTESRQKARGLFLATHRPFRQIRVDFCKEQGGATGFITEEDLRAIVHECPLAAHNRLFFIAGEAGCGKSELCQWLEYTADTTSRLPVHIPRSMTTAAHVVTRLRKELRQIGSNTETLLRTPVATQARYAALSAVVLLYERGAAISSPAHLWEPLLASSEIAADLAKHLATARTGEDSIPLLPVSRFQELCAKYWINLEPTHTQATADALRSLLLDALDQTVWLGDLRELLSQLSRHAISAGRRPLLLIEDLTAFQVLSDTLLDYLLDLTSGHYDAVIGLTTGFERTQLLHASLAEDLTHIHQRLRARFVLTDDQGRAYGLEEDVVEFTRAYLQAAVQGRDAAELNADLPDAFTHGLYPFTETALHRAFACLQEEGNPRQTPRLLIEHVLSAVLLAQDFPPSVLDQSPYLRRPPVLFRHDDIGSEMLVSLLRWYGEIGEREVTLERAIADYWSVAVPERLCKDGVIRVPRAYVMQDSLHLDLVPTWQQHLRELQHWLDTGGLYPSRETLKRGIERVLLSLGDPRVLGSPDSLALTRSDLYYARGDERLPIYLGDDSGDVPGREAFIKVEVARTSEERSILEELGYLALSGGEFAQTFQNLASMLEWAQRHWDTFNGQVRLLLTERLGGVSVGELVWVSWRLVASAVGDPWASTPHLRTWNSEAAPYADCSPWNPIAHRSCYAAAEQLAAWHETIRRLFIGMFALRESLLDLEQCRRTTTRLDLAAVLERMAVIPTRPLRTAPFKIRPGGQSLYDLVVPLQRYARALVDLDVGVSLRKDQAELTRLLTQMRCQEGMDFNDLRKHLQELRWRCGELGVVWQQAWSISLQTLESLTAEDIGSLRREVDRLIEECVALAAADAPDIWRYQEFRHRFRPVHQHTYWEAIATLDLILKEALQVARRRYRNDGRSLTGTEIYRELLGSVRALQERLCRG